MSPYKVYKSNFLIDNELYNIYVLQYGTDQCLFIEGDGHVTMNHRWVEGGGGGNNYLMYTQFDIYIQFSTVQ